MANAPHHRGLQLQADGTFWVVINSDGYPVAVGTKATCEKSLRQMRVEAVSEEVPVDVLEARS